MSCGTRVPDFRPGDPDGAWLLRSSLGMSYLLNGPCVLGQNPTAQLAGARACSRRLHRVMQLTFAAYDARQFISAAACVSLATRETVSTRMANVYFSQHRFSAFEAQVIFL